MPAIALYDHWQRDPQYHIPVTHPAFDDIATYGERPTGVSDTWADTPVRCARNRCAYSLGVQTADVSEFNTDEK
jgi:hypothetical protein